MERQHLPHVCTVAYPGMLGIPRVNPVQQIISVSVVCKAVGTIFQRWVPWFCHATPVKKPGDTQEPATPFIPWISGVRGELSWKIRLHHSHLFL